MHGNRVKDTLHGRPADGAAGERILDHPLNYLKGVPPLAAVLVSRHGASSIGVRTVPSASLSVHESL